MPSPPPPEHTRFKPGQSGNPAGYSKARRVSAALDRLLDEIGGSDKDLALTLYAMATGRKELIKGRKPEFMWFQALMERTDGKVPTPKDDDPDAPAKASADVVRSAKDRAEARRKRTSKPDG